MKQVTCLAMLVALSALLATGCRKMEFQAPPATNNFEVSKQLVNDADTCSLLENVSKTAAAKAAGRSLTASTLVTIFVDSDGQANVDGAPWGILGTFNCPASGVPAGKLDSMAKMTVEDYGYWEIVFVKDEQSFQAAPYPKMRAILTKKTAIMRASPILSGVSGVSYLSSMLWNDNTPCFIFNDITGSDKYKKLAEIISHELGHTFGIPHESEPDGTPCGFLGEYKHPSADFQNGSIMGNPYQARFTRWIIGKSVSLACGEVLNDVQIISSVAVLKEEPYCGVFNSNTPVLTSTLINTVLVHSENQHAFKKTGSGTKILKLISKGNGVFSVGIINPVTGQETIHGGTSNGNVTVSITGTKFIRVFVTQPDNFPPSPVGGGYSIKLQ